MNNVKRALRAEAIVKRLDPSRIVYHHSSGNLGSMHTSNFYPNFAPIQEMSDWFEHWATKGVKPVFTCEYGAPFTWDWTMYRGWYKGKRAFGSAAVPWEFCLAEWNAQFLGDRAFQISEPEKAEPALGGQAVPRRQALAPLGLSPRRRLADVFDDRYPVFAMYLTDNWRAFRTWGMSANLALGARPLLEAARRRRQGPQGAQGRLGEPAAAGLQPGLHRRSGTSGWTWPSSAPTGSPRPAAQALLRNNLPLLAYIGGKPARFTSKDHNFLPGRDGREADSSSSTTPARP